MQLTVDTMGPEIMAGLGEVGLDDVTTAEVLLVTVLIDDSGSIRFEGNTEAVRVGHNTLLDALKGAKQAGAVLVSCRYLNGHVLYPYRPLDGAERMDASNYNPGGGTPLYDQVAVMLAGVTAKMAEFENGGVAARAVSVIVTDGADAGSRTHTAATVLPMVKALLQTEAHIVIGVGIDDGSTDFTQIFKEMGVIDEWVLTPSNSPSEIRRAFQTVSQSAVKASQMVGANFSQLTQAGFGVTP
jgi:hypothetical protein